MKISSLENVSFNSSEIDKREGNYYVSIVDGDKFNLLLGAFKTHQEALNMVEPVRKKSYELNRDQMIFAGFGTVRIEGYDKPGLLNKYFDM